MTKYMVKIIVAVDINANTDEDAKELARETLENIGDITKFSVSIASIEKNVTVNVFDENK